MEFIHTDVFWRICLVRGFYYAIFTCHHSNSCCIIFVSSQQKYWNNRRKMRIFCFLVTLAVRFGLWFLKHCHLGEMLSLWPLWVTLDLREVLVRVFIRDSFMNSSLLNVNWSSLQINLHSFCLLFLSVLPHLCIFDVSLNKVCHLDGLFMPLGRLRHVRCSVYLESWGNIRLLRVHLLIYFGSWHGREIASYIFLSEGFQSSETNFFPDSRRDQLLSLEPRNLCCRSYYNRGPRIWISLTYFHEESRLQWVRW